MTDAAKSMSINLTVAGIEGCIRNAQRQIERIERIAVELAVVMDLNRPTPFQRRCWGDAAAANAQGRIEWAAKLEVAEEALKMRIATLRKFPSRNPNWTGE